MQLGRRLRLWLPTDVGTMRRAALYVVIVALAVSLGGSSRQGAGAALLALAAVPVLSMLAWQVRRWRAHLFGAAAGVVAVAVPETQTLWPAVTALVALSVYEDHEEWPWPAAVGGLAGSVLGIGLYPFLATPAAFLGVVFGIGVGALMRGLRRFEGESQQLRQRTKVSEEQALWLEQRTALARELHDVVGHHVTAMVVQAEAGLVGDARAALGSIGELGRAALTELDGLVVHLRDPAAPVTVTAPPRLSDIDELLAAPLRQQGVDVSVRVDPEPGLDEVGVLTAYRIAQEALTNVTRHAGASSAWVELTRHEEHVRLRVSDDGVGPPAEVERGAGLVGIAERVRSVDGHWDMSERPGGGTIVDVFLPAPVVAT